MKRHVKNRNILYLVGGGAALWLYIYTCLKTGSIAIGRELEQSKFGDTPTIQEEIIIKDASNEVQAQHNLVQSSKHATVMGMAKGYGQNEYKRFVGTLRATGFEGHIILIVSPPEEIDKRAEKYLISQNATIKHLIPTNCTTAPQHLLRKKERNQVNPQEKERVTCGHPYPELKLRWGRFALLRDYLEECQDCTGPVLIADVRDTFFQRDPFGPEAPPVTGLQVFEEDPHQRTTHWITKGPIQKCYKIKIFDKVMLCSGTTIGTRAAMLQYLQTMVHEMREWLKNPDCNRPGNGDDQSIHNYLYYTGKLDIISNAKAVPNGGGLVHTVGTFASQAFVKKRAQFAETLNISLPNAQALPFTTDQEETKGNWLGSDWNKDMDVTYPVTDQQGYIINSNGERSFVIHQYDRFGSPLERWLMQSGPCSKGVCDHALDFGLDQKRKAIKAAKEASNY